jgi:4-amino-4-deoxy-L-arabinose transferase-like glycosyltransferase
MPDSNARALPRWLLAAVVTFLVFLIYVASITVCGPWDPWETHYGEVARNIVLRRDPLDLWWRPGVGPDGNDENVFYSKHALPFWAMAASMWLFGIGASANPAEMVQGPLPELALRLPALLVTLAAIATSAIVARRLAGDFAAFTVGLAVATLPQLAIAGRQAITDPFFLAPFTIGLLAWVMATEGPRRELRAVGRGWWRISIDRATLLAAGVYCLVAILPLVVLELHAWSPYTHARVARFKGNNVPTTEHLRTIGFVLAGYLVLAIGVLVAIFKARDVRETWAFVLYAMAGVALMGKGMLGPGILGAVVLLDLWVTGRWSRLLHVRLGLGVLIFVVTCVPWHHAMWLYRGERWAQELLITHNLARFASGEHPQAVGSFSFYLRTFGLAALPWSAALIPAGAFALGRIVRSTTEEVRRDEGTENGPGPNDTDDHEPGPTQARRDALLRVSALAAIVAFAVVAYAATKYHHYLLPVLPPLGLLIGLWLEDVWTRSARDADASAALRVTAFVVGLATMALVLRWAWVEPASIAHLTTYLYTGTWREGGPSTAALPWLCVPFAIGLGAWALRRHREGVVAMLLSALLVTAWTLNDYLPKASEEWSQRTLFRTYFAARGPKDVIASWWLYYRGETYFTKGNVWVMMEPDRTKLIEFIDTKRGQDLAIWFVTAPSHAKRLPSHLPPDLAPLLERIEENHHVVLLRLKVP